LSAKAFLRQEALKHRRVLSPADRTRQSALIAEHVLQSESFKWAATVASYVSWATEPDTRLINETALTLGKTLLCPAASAKPARASAQPARASATPAWTRTTPDRRSTEAAAEDLAEADLIIVPALLIDAQGTRLGRGLGWYDRALRAAKPGAAIMALLFDEEFSEQTIPREPHDFPVNLAVLPGGIVGPLPVTQITH
jgi:5-formyltetrahydrofolate cyclo-ligase